MKTQFSTSPFHTPLFYIPIFFAPVFSLFAGGCTAGARDVVKTKVFALTPDTYLEQKVSTQGKVSTRIPAGAGFLLTDDSGSVFVSTQFVAERFTCPEGANIFIEGFLRKNSSIEQTYFMMTKVHECQTSPSNESRQ